MKVQRRGRNYYYNIGKNANQPGQLQDSIHTFKAEISGKAVSTEVYNDPELMQNDPQPYLHGSNSLEYKVMYDICYPYY